MRRLGDVGNDFGTLGSGLVVQVAGHLGQSFLDNDAVLARARQHCVAGNALIVGILLHRPHRIELELCELLLQIGRKLWTSAAELVEFARESQQ